VFVLHSILLFMRVMKLFTRPLSTEILDTKNKHEK